MAWKSPFWTFALNRKVSGSQVGRIRETQDYSAANNIHPEVEITDTDGDDRYRYP